MTAHCHSLIKATAQEMAAAAYEEIVRQNPLNALMKTQSITQDRFVRLNWGRHIDGARQILAGMLTGPYDDITKDQISDALIKDGSLVRGRRRVS